MGIPGLSSFVWANRDKISSHFFCNSNKRTYTLQCKNKTISDDDMKEKFESVVIKTKFERKREWIIFDAYSITPNFFSSKKSPFMDFYHIKNKLKDWMDCWLQCGFKLIFVFDGYSSWINNEKLDETLHRNAGRYRDIKRLNQHLSTFHEYYSKKIIQSRYDKYISETKSETVNDEKKIDKAEKKNEKLPENINWTYKLNDSMYAGYSSFMVNIFYSLSQNNENVKIWMTKSEADQQIAGWVNDNQDKVFGICSSDSDFFVFDFENIWIINAKSIKYKKTNRYFSKNIKRYSNNNGVNLNNYINNANNNEIECPCVAFVATKPEHLWQYIHLNENYEQRLFYTQIVGMDIIAKKDPKNFVKEFDLEGKIKDVNDRNEIAFAIANIVKLHCLNKENKINDKIREFYKFKSLDLCGLMSSKDELLIEGYITIKHMYECTNDINKIIPVHIALKPIRMRMYKRYINKIKNNVIKEYVLNYNHMEDKTDLKITDIGINDLIDCKCLPYPSEFNDNNNINNNYNWSFHNMLLLIIQSNNILNEYKLLTGNEEKGNAMILQLKWRRIYTSKSYSMYRDNEIDNKWNIQNAIKCFKHFTVHSMPKSIDLYVQSLFIKCVRYICWDIQMPPIELLFCGPLFHFICQNLEQKEQHNSNQINYNQILPLFVKQNQ